MLHFICFFDTTDNFFKLHSVKKSKLLYICVLVSFGFRESGEEISENRGRKVEKRTVFAENQFLVKICFFLWKSAFYENQHRKIQLSDDTIHPKIGHPYSTPPSLLPARYQVTQRSNSGLNILAYAIVFKCTLARKNASKTHQNCLKIAVLRVHLSC